MNEKNDLKKSTEEVKKEELEKIVLEKPKEEDRKPRMRTIVIETDGNNIRISRNETAGNLELLAVLQALMGSITSSK